jgi:hypothetical protein
VWAFDADKEGATTLSFLYVSIVSNFVLNQASSISRQVPKLRQEVRRSDVLGWSWNTSSC